MSPDFKWRTEEGATWDDEVLAVESARRSSHWRLTLSLLLLALFGLAGFIALRQIRHRVESVAEEVESEVLASYRVIQQAAEERDVELMRNFLSGQVPRWSATQEMLVREGTLFERRGLELQLLSAGDIEEGKETGGTVIEEVIISPDLQEAEVVTLQAYAIDIGHGLTETIRLRQSTIFRLGSSRWLYAPREDAVAYWGDWVTRKGQFLTATYRLRDEEWALRLTEDIDLKLISLCSNPWTRCAAGLHVELQFDDDPASLKRVSHSNDFIHEQGQPLVLPTISLVGHPLDEVAYRALYRGYATHVVATALTNEVWQWPYSRCCQKQVFFHALLDSELSRLHLTPSLLTVADYKHLEDQATLLEDLAPLWDRPEGTDDASVQTRALVTFLREQNPSVTNQLLVQTLWQTDSYWNWLESVAGDKRTLQAEWLQFVSLHAAE